MTPEVMKDIPDDEFEMFQRIRLIVKEMPDVDLGKDKKGKKIPISCHMVAHALGYFFPVSVRDGKVYGAWNHSWLETKSWLIIDPYPIAMLGGPVMVFARSYGSPWGKYYIDPDKPFLWVSQEPFLTHLRIVKYAMQETVARLFLHSHVQ